MLNEIGLPNIGDGDIDLDSSIHAVAWFSGVDWQEVNHALTHQWPVPRQAHLELARSHLEPEQNIQNIVNYALKHKCQTKLGHAVVDWPAAWLGQYYTWLHSWTELPKHASYDLSDRSVGNPEKRSSY